MTQTYKTFLILSFVCYAGVGAVLAQADTSAYWPDGFELDFGIIDERGVEHYDSLRLYNPTSEPFVIENIRPSCGCTAVDWPNTPVEPGMSVPIPVAFRCTKGGFVERHLDVYLSHLRDRERIFVLADCPER